MRPNGFKCFGLQHGSTVYQNSSPHREWENSLCDEVYEALFDEDWTVVGLENTGMGLGGFDWVNDLGFHDPPDLMQVHIPSNRITLVWL
tara:strand:- start:3091 stop:3357 length:267 start_codon:yes stop_codon:yes gene_type:complete